MNSFSNEFDLKVQDTKRSTFREDSRVRLPLMNKSDVHSYVTELEQLILDDNCCFPLLQKLRELAQSMGIWDVDALQEIAELCRLIDQDADLDLEDDSCSRVRSITATMIRRAKPLSQRNDRELADAVSVPIPPPKNSMEVVSVWDKHV